ncbi:ead/Ea22-like family protein [Escherichia coli]|nr:MULTISPECIES: ead/Ea22-like family protein [Enterobacteriaceae]EJC4989114.1 ead/Ea22-like family protein [Escherichia coli]EJC5124249.1 ead/Ea22-like family protein [Escherichia coli]EJF3547450.1 ead/Ea22-like family protein [Escherichia coli]MBL1446932.1 ead/Ea22-like family protein [Salmonella enterica subsp. enterica serovar Typhimurium]MCD6758678.1 ead/Ea22-like family protein [Escherichia coli]
MSKINYQELREAAEQATQDEWVAYILPGHNGIYPARTSEGRHCGYFIDWPGVCQGRESISIRTYAVNCNDAWLNTEGDDISGSYVKYKDHQEVVAALEAKCAALAVENELARKAVQAFCDVVGDNTEVIAEVVGRDGVLVILEAMKATGNMPATDAFLAEVRAQGVDMARNAMIDFVDGEVGPNKNVPGLIRGAEICVSIAELLRKGGNQ